MQDIPHIGPILFKGRTTQITNDGPEIVTDEIFTPTTKPDPWIADWIWLDPEEFPDFQTTPVTCGGNIPVGTRVVAYFRKEIQIDNTPEHAFAWVSGDRKSVV